MSISIHILEYSGYQHGFYLIPSRVHCLLVISCLLISQESGPIKDMGLLSKDHCTNKGSKKHEIRLAFPSQPGSMSLRASTGSPKDHPFPLWGMFLSFGFGNRWDYFHPNLFIDNNWNWKYFPIVFEILQIISKEYSKTRADRMYGINFRIAENRYVRQL